MTASAMENNQLSNGDETIGRWSNVAGRTFKQY